MCHLCDPMEVVLGAGLKLVENVEYNESGRGVYPDDLYRMLLQFDPPAISLEAFAIYANMIMEWADGYGPKFGLVAVDRANNLARIPRPSYHLFSKIVNTGKVTHEDRERAWDELQRAAKEKKTRPFYRAVDKHRLMYADGGSNRPIVVFFEWDKNKQIVSVDV
ncbi:hypothetical protein JHK86_015644 [Glycine max]|nr:hypothetical protein JHK86_015644 [Glycine max]